MATNSAALDVAELIKLCLKTFWSATWMEVPPILLQPEQFSGWMTVLHTLLVRPVPEVRIEAAAQGSTCLALSAYSCRQRHMAAGSGGSRS